MRLPVKKAPRWVWWFYYVSIAIFCSVVGTYVYRKIAVQEAHDARIAAWDLEQKTKKEKRAKAERLAKEGYGVLLAKRREELRALCRAQGNVPLQFWDKFVCVKPDAIAWEKFDPNPEQMQ